MTVGVEPDLSREVELFLYREALLLDTWQLDQWLELFEADAVYHVPPTSRPNGTTAETQMLITDDHDRLVARVARLESQNAHSERPRSRLCRQISNVLATAVGDDVHVTANAVIWRFRLGMSDHYVVRYRHTLVRRDGGLRFRVRRAELVHEALSPAGRLSFIV